MQSWIALVLALPLAAETSWTTTTPAQAGFDPAKLQTLVQDLAARRTAALLIVRHGKIVLEWYAPGNDPGKRQGTASLAKAIVGGMSLLVAIDDRRIAPGDLASQYIPAWRDDPRKARITIRHLATHSSGIEDAEQDGLPHDQLPGWKGAFWRREPDPFSLALQAPVLFDPGTSYAYSNPGMAALSYVVTAALRGAPQADVRALLDERIMRPLAIPAADWSIGYGRDYALDGLHLYANWGGGAFTPRAVARLGLFMLQRGAWNGRQIVAAETVDQSLAYAGTPLSRDAAAAASGLGWWLNTNGGWAGVPKDAFGGAGAGHELLLVVPSLDLVVVRNGQALADARTAGGYWPPAVENVFRPVVEAIAQKAPYPPSPAIRKVGFAPPAAVRCQAIDSDNWPITWGDDGLQYTAYGDGWGFDPRVEKKLSQGFARIEGPPASFQGVNLRTETGERTGDGARGLKASGILMVDRVLYLWVRNAANAQLAWSPDHGRTWEWGFVFDTAFGSPAFLNFGPNYRGAPDDYVYTYSQSGGNAYRSDDALLLARAPRHRLRERAAWEFFERLDERANPVWTRDLAHRGEAFRYPRHCQRVDAVYHPGLRRYLLALGYNHESGWGLYDAPHPWGPWTTVFHTEAWDLPNIHGYRLPAKWIEPGRMTLIFSGLKPYDAFCVRPFTLELAR